MIGLKKGESWSPGKLGRWRSFVTSKRKYAYVKGEEHYRCSLEYIG